MPFDAREIGGDGEQAAEERAIRLGQLRRRRDVAPRDQQDVRRSARRDVAERDDQVVLVHEVGRDRTGSDPAEEAASTGGRPPRCGAHHSTGFELIRNPIVPTSPAIRYDT